MNLTLPEVFSLICDDELLQGRETISSGDTEANKSMADAYKANIQMQHDSELDELIERL